MAKEILLIDDDIDDLQFFCDALEAIDPSIKCRDFPSCMKALHFFIPAKQQLPIAIFIDLSMPKMDGIECVIAVKSNSLLKDAPVFVISGYVPEKDRLQLANPGVAGFVTKPDSFEKLKDEVSRLMFPLLR